MYLLALSLLDCYCFLFIFLHLSKKAHFLSVTKIGHIAVPLCRLNNHRQYTVLGRVDKSKEERNNESTRVVFLPHYLHFQGFVLIHLRIHEETYKKSAHNMDILLSSCHRDVALYTVASRGHYIYN